MKLSEREFLKYLGIGPEKFLVDVEIVRRDYTVNRPLDETKVKMEQVVITGGVVHRLTIYPRFERPKRLSYRVSITLPIFYAVLDMNTYGRKSSSISITPGISGTNSELDGTLGYGLHVLFEERLLDRRKNLPVDFTIVPQVKDIVKQGIIVEVEGKNEFQDPRYTNEEFELETIEGKVILYHNGKEK